MNPDVVVFNVFGTLLKCERHHQPYLRLMKWAHQNGLQSHTVDLKSFMLRPGGLQEAATWLGMSPPNTLLSEWNDELQANIRSIQCYPEVLPTLARLRQLGYRIGLCSNLAESYGISVQNQLPILDACVFSYQVGALKPQREIYRALLDGLACPAGRVLFVGNSPQEDVLGPRSFGMKARFLARWKWDLDEVLGDLLAGRGIFTSTNSTT